MEVLSEEQYRAANPDRLRIYDISLDQFRDVTQYDVDQLLIVSNSWGKMRLAAEAGVRGLEDLKRNRK